ncbi:MAG: hypothetical protein WBH44_07000 [Proteocatella sp.]
MKDVIKSIIKIDKDAIKKEEDFKSMIDDIEKQKKIKLKTLKDEVEANTKKIIADYQKKVLDEIESETREIRETSREKAKALKERYLQFEEKVTQDSFDMILRNLEE